MSFRTFDFLSLHFLVLLYECSYFGQGTGQKTKTNFRQNKSVLTLENNIQPKVLKNASSKTWKAVDYMLSSFNYSIFYPGGLGKYK